MPEIKFVPVDLALVGIVDQLAIRPDDEEDVVLRKGVMGYDDPG
jgi:ethanolamine utilization protein EutN